MIPAEHTVAVRIGGQLVTRWSDYSIESDMLKPADSFRLTLPGAKREVFELCAPDVDVQVLLDDTTILTGFIDDRTWSVDANAGTSVTITGRDRGGRLLDESMPLTSFVGLGIKQLAEKVVDPWFPRGVTLSNAENRRLIRGKGARTAAVSSEPPIHDTPRAAKKVAPGESRWQVLQSFLEEAELVAWATADGERLFVGLPNYAQAPQYVFFVPREGSARAAEGNVLSMTVEHSVGERYSAIVAVGSSHGDGANYSDRVTKRRGIARNGPGEHGTGKDFRHRKVLIVSDDDIRDGKQAQVRAEREMAERDATGHRIELRVAGHGQGVGFEGRPVLYAHDAMARVEVEELGLKGDYLVTAVTFERSADAGETTTIRLVPKGTTLRL